MGHKYQAVQWNGNKIVYDVVAVLGVIAFMGVFMAVGLQPHATGHTADPVVLAIKALGATAFTMMTLVLMIGPLARLSPRFLPFLYNRRHFGVLTALVAGAHFGLALLWYHGGGPLSPFVSLMASGLPGDPFPGVPFELFGLGAFAILLVMAATSHDFWLNNLSAPAWKALHMSVYAAYGLVVLHVAYGALATKSSPVYAPIVYGAAGGVALLHLVAGLREWGRDNGMKGQKAEDGWIAVGEAGAIPDRRAVIAPLPKGDRVAVFRDGLKVYAVQNACRHQNGPLGEGCIIDGSVTCPWHGWQYDPADGVSPPPFTERIKTYDVRIDGGVAYVRVAPNPLGETARFATLEALATASAEGGAP
ncbi:MAG: Rieske 2Fe-2S domain-containing protein [Parvularculaceae bacterium]